MIKLNVDQKICNSKISLVFRTERIKIDLPLDGSTDTEITEPIMAVKKTHKHFTCIFCWNLINTSRQNVLTWTPHRTDPTRWQGCKIRTARNLWQEKKRTRSSALQNNEGGTIQNPVYLACNPNWEPNLFIWTTIQRWNHFQLDYFFLWIKKYF